MESGLKSLSSSARSPSLMACKPCCSTIHHLAKAPRFPQAPAPPLLPLPVHLQPSPQCASWPVTESRPVLLVEKPRRTAPSPKKPANGASAPIFVAAASKKRTAAEEAEQEVEWTSTDSLYSVSPPPSCVPMPTSLLVSTAAGRKVPTACAVEVAGGGGCVDVCATDELRRLLRL